MKNQYFKMLILMSLGLACPEGVGAEMMRLAITNQDLAAVEELANPYRGEEQKIVKWGNKRVEKYEQFLSKGKENGRGGKIAAIVFLSLGIILFGLFGFALLLGAVEGWYFWGSGFAIVLVLVSLAFLALCAVCIRGVIKVIRKLHRLKYGEPPEELPRRPPSRNLKHQ